MIESKWFIFGACNPMIDIAANVDPEFLLKYELLPNNAIVGDETHFKIYDEIKAKYSDSITYTSGGSGQNTLRIASWILNVPNSTVFMGSVGNDEYADIIVEKANEIGLKTLLHISNKSPTATCAVLLNNKNRSMVAHLGAAYDFHESFLDSAKNWSFIENSRLFYFTGFFFCTCINAVMRVAKYAQENDRVFTINLSALFLTQYFKKELMQALPYVDIIFGNDDEAISFAKNVLNIQITDVKKIARLISNMRKVNLKRKRLVVITCADKPVILFDGNKILEIEVRKIEPSQIVDTSCAGDAFVGGFLAQYVKGETLEKCIDCGIWASSIIIQRPGCDFPLDMEYF